MIFTEDFLHYIWKFQLFEHKNLYTIEGENIEIIASGTHNTDSGPDFHTAKIRIADTLWAGNVEVHIASSDWVKHDHQIDNAYHNVILHVVYTYDQPLFLSNGRKVPTIELKERISANLYNQYHQLIYGNQTIIPCEKTIHTIDSITIQNWLTRVLIGRLEKKSIAVIETLKLNRGDWEETFYQYLAANFGFKTNSLPFELLAKSIPQNIYAKLKNNPIQIEALIFGQAGLLIDNFKDEYPLKLKAEYAFLAKKYNLKPIESHLWKFMRLRPQNFPTIRLAQFAALIVSSNHLFSKILETNDVKTLRELFTDLKVNAYWNKRYRFDTESIEVEKNIGASSIDILLINTVAIFLFCYGKHYELHNIVDKSLKVLEILPKENNKIIQNFSTLGVKIKSAFESQALLELNGSYCSRKKCLQCAIGNKILKLN
jgi:hypothetical protein